MNRCRYVFGVVVLCSALPAWAAVCQNSTGVAKDISYDLSGVFNHANNRPGEIVTLAQKSGLVGVNAICPRGTTGRSTMRSYVTSLPVTTVIDSYKYLKLNDYLDGAMQIHDDFVGTFYPPANFIQMGEHHNVSNNSPFPVNDSRLVFRLRVTRRFINMVVIPPQKMFSVYVTTTSSDPLNTEVYSISYSGTIQVPQSCAINAGQIVEFDFGDIRASLFSDAGAGNRPQKISPQSKTVAIKCTNVEANAYLTMRIEADSDNVQGNALVSDNKDLGFVVANASGTPLTPNSLASKVPFRLDDSGQAQVGIRVWPVSVTGNKPAEGRFTSRGYLRVDYD
ncbi:type 1 fimbria D-mannose specific adhesin FimH [unidentified bacterial endosymbiont]|uniref:type 1 fimbria D-mannose specific adhesin FimH n=1 Tax=unidentified bacterial endosymbiont TaxID=2355 RepID=UPI00209DA275|nr:type 1 fimbria D-mannose specific adhesin FimH [unidentified bacterial endosymbiont]